MNGIKTTLLAQRLEGLLDSPNHFRVAKLLVQYPDKEFTGREIARMLGVGHTSVRKALEDIVDSGLAQQKSIGRANVYRSNEESYLFKAVQDWVGVERGLQDEILSSLRSRLRDVASSVIIFGSYVQGTPNKRSDLDLLIVAKDIEKVEERLAALQGSFVRRYALRISPKVFTEEQLAKKASARYLKEASEQGIVVVGEPIELVR